MTLPAIQLQPNFWAVNLEGFNSTIRAVPDTEGAHYDALLSSLFVTRLTVPDMHECCRGVARWRDDHPDAFVHREGCEPQACIPREQKPARHQGRIVRRRGV